MAIALWIVQALLGLAFFMAGLMKLTQPKEKLAENMAWVEDYEPTIIKGIGLLEILGAIGVILPVALNILPFLAPLAAGGLVLTMIGAIIVHFRRNELPQTVPGLVLGAMAAFVLWQTVSLLPL